MFDDLSSPVDWNTWRPDLHATLMFIIKEERILLIKKRRGIGAGKVNGPGGKIEQGETPLEGAIRETQEELGVTPLHVQRMGELFFSMTDLPQIHCHVFIAKDLEGSAITTDEAIPLWTPLSDIPYHLMWEDDQHWLPEVLNGRTFEGYFHFEGEDIQWKHLTFDVPVRTHLDNT